MTLRVAINGFGRIGRNFTRCWLSRGLDTGIEVVGLNDTSDPRTNSHLLQYDTMLGHIRDAEVSYTDDTIVVNGVQRARPGGKVTAVAEKPAAAPVPAPAAPAKG